MNTEDANLINHAENNDEMNNDAEFSEVNSENIPLIKNAQSKVDSNPKKFDSDAFDYEPDHISVIVSISNILFQIITYFFYNLLNENLEKSNDFYLNLKKYLIFLIFNTFIFGLFCECICIYFFSNLKKKVRNENCFFSIIVLLIFISYLIFQNTFIVDVSAKNLLKY